MVPGSGNGIGAGRANRSMETDTTDVWYARDDEDEDVLRDAAAAVV